jgi:hypothetical protein
LPVVIAQESDPRPAEAHVSFKLLTGLVKLGSSDELLVDKSNGIITLRGHREFTVAIEAVGNPVSPQDDLETQIRATDILQGVHLSLDLPSVRDKFSAVGVAIVNEGTVTDISQILETETEPRALLEIVLRARFDVIDDVGYFDRVQFSGDLDTDCDGVDDYTTGTIEVA